MGTNKSEVSTKLFDELIKFRFFVPTYQRGFRWKKQQMRELIDDLCDFYDNDYQEKYCLQPLMICKKDEDTFEVADGQQRLSALWILKVLKGLALRDKNILDSDYLYEMKFEGKKNYEKARSLLEEKVKEMISNKSPDSDFETFLETFDSKGDIDSEFFIQAVKFVWNEYRRNNVRSFQEVAETLFPDKPKDIKGKDIINKKYEFVWYNYATNTPEETKNKIIKKFQDMNASSVHLTEAELIKAYFIQNYGENKLEFSYQWEQFERDLNNDSFWWFMAPEGSEPDTRMDFLFETYIKSVQDNKGGESHELSNSIKKLIEAKSADVLWKEIVTLHNTLMWWYHDYFFYHTIGYLVATAGKKKDIIATTYKNYKGRTKDALREYVIGEIKKAIGYKDDNYDFMEVSYGDNNKNVIKILLLYNIALLLNAYAINPDNSAERFPFEYYRQAGIDIEHINAKHLENEDFEKELTDEAKNSKKLKWAGKIIELIENDSDRKKLSNKLTNLSNNWDATAFERLAEQIEDAADINKLNNLALLDMHVNRKYHDAPFEDKKGHIAAARFGLPIPQGSLDDDLKKDKYKDLYDEKNKDLEEKYGKLEVCFMGDDDKPIIIGRSDRKAFFTSEQAAKVRKVKITLEPKNNTSLMEANLIQLSFSGVPSSLGKAEVTAGSNTCVINVKEDKITEDKPCVVKIRIDHHKRGRYKPVRYAFVTEGRYERSVIFPGTMWVFMRQYTKISVKAKKRTTTKERDASLVWDKDDRFAYENQMKDSIRELLGK